VDRGRYLGWEGPAQPANAACHTPMPRTVCGSQRFVSEVITDISTHLGWRWPPNVSFRLWREGCKTNPRVWDEIVYSYPFSHSIAHNDQQ
jgi:hypothetical protein